jgi:hypothetical protein
MKLEIGQKVKINNLVLECKRIIKDGSPREIYECRREECEPFELDEDALEILGAQIVRESAKKSSDKEEDKRTVWTVTTIGPDYECNIDRVITRVFPNLNEVIRELNCISAVDRLKQGLETESSVFIKKGADLMEKREILEKDGFYEWICFNRQYIVKRHLL